MGKRIGLILATIHQGSSTTLWKAIAEESERRQDESLFVLPCGRLNFSGNNEYLRNEILSLVNSKNLDDLIVWTSSLTGKEDYKDIAEYVKKINDDVPSVSMGLSIEGIPSVDFNAYSGFFSEVDHMIRVHGCKRIAMVRGPESHNSAETRFAAYRDALTANSIEFDPNIVASPVAWSDGKKAMKELIEYRNLVPGKDFDAIVFASDLLMFWASKYLDSRGVRIPRDLKIAGFNDSDENRMMSVDSTTVKMPIKSLATTAYSLASGLGAGEDDSSVDIVLPTSMILRHSCGCDDSFGGIDNARAMINSWDGIHKWLRDYMDNTKAADAAYGLLELLYKDNVEIQEDNMALITPYMETYFDNGGGPKLLFESVKWVEAFLSDRKLTSNERDTLFSLMGYQMNRSNAREDFRESLINRMLNKLKLDLLALGSDLDLSRCLQQDFPPLGISRAFICTSKDDDTTTLRSGFSGSTLFKGGEDFPSRYMLPEQYQDLLDGGIFVVQPLIYDSNNVGYMIVQTTLTEGRVLEDIRTAVSAAMKGISLVAIASEKSRKAEEEEKKSADFYARLSDGLREPLGELKKLVGSDVMDKEAMLAFITQAEHLVELSLADKGEFSLSRQFVPISMLLHRLRDLGFEVSSADNLPSIDLDLDKVVQVFSILKSAIVEKVDIPQVVIRLESTHLSILVSGRKGAWKPALAEKDTSILLSEKIVLMHGGDFSFTARSVNITLPFLSLSYRIGSDSNIGSILFISNDNDSIPESIIPLDHVVVSQDKLLQGFVLPPNCVSIALDVGNAEPSNILINLLRNHIAAKELPFLLFGVDNISISVATALEGSLPKSEKATIFSFGEFPSTLSKLSEFGRVVEVDSIKDAEVSEGNGSLAIFYDFDMDILNELRQSKKFNKTPVLIVKDQFDISEANALMEIPNVLIINTAITESEDFISRIVGIFGGGELLPALTSVLVKKAIAYINKNASQQISRWQLAEAVNISEDYLTRIFRKEVGISPWDYLNRYRIQLACKLLTQTGLSINEIAQDTGFQDQAYFCRVFKKVKGFPPGHIRQRM